jgi:hypothetical protein
MAATIRVVPTIRVAMAAVTARFVSQLAALTDFWRLGEGGGGEFHTSWDFEV